MQQWELEKIEEDRRKAEEQRKKFEIGYVKLVLQMTKHKEWYDTSIY